MQGVLDIYGRNVVTTEGADWRMHRKITSRPFSEKNNQLVHEESVRQATQMMAAWQAESHNGAILIERYIPNIHLPRPQIQTMKFALHVISGAGFGVPFTWEESSDEIWPNHKMSFRDAVDTLMHNLLAIVLLPKKLLKLPIKALRTSEQAYTEFGAYMHDLLDREKKLGKDSNGQNLMSVLVKHAASEQNVSTLGVLQDEEIIGNTFIFLLAGHETT
jgi:cytochrome P450